MITAADLQILTVEEKQELLCDWYGRHLPKPIAREKQIPPDWDWNNWLISAGRGFGKTRTGAEKVRDWAESGDFEYIHLVGATAADVRDVMVEGPAGILSVFPEYRRPHYEPSKRRITCPNGVKMILFSADEPERLRGPQCHKAWADELAAWRYPEAWDQLQFGLRLGKNPQVVVTTTPRPTKIIKELVADPKTAVTTGSTYENRDNLSPQFFDVLMKRYEGTTLGRQEIHAEILADVEGALWKQSDIDGMRVDYTPDLWRIVVGVDPSASSTKDSDEAGIVVAGIGYDQRFYILDDVSGIMSPNGWAGAAIEAYQRHRADAIIAERNNGGDMVQAIIYGVDRTANVVPVWASRGKVTRAEPVAALYEQGRVSHVGTLPGLENEMTTWIPGQGASPNRVDALVWAISALNEGETEVYASN